MANPVIYWEVGAREARKLCEFYANLFNWEMEAQSEDYFLLHNEGMTGAIITAPDEMLCRPILYANVDSLHQFMFRAVQLGGHVLSPAREVMEGESSAMFQDPEGNAFGLVRGTDL